MAIWIFLDGRKAKLHVLFPPPFNSQFTLNIFIPFFFYASHKDIILLITPSECCFYLEKGTLELPYGNTWCLSGTVGENSLSTLMPHMQENVSVTQMILLKKKSMF